MEFGISEFTVGCVCTVGIELVIIGIATDFVDKVGI